MRDALRTAALTMIVLALWGMRPALAHHSVTSEYDMQRSVEIEGQVRSVDIGSPHSHLTLSVGSGEAAMVWNAEFPSMSYLRHLGWNPQALVVGEHLHLTGSPSRHTANTIYLTRIVKGDGSELSLVLPTP